MANLFKRTKLLSKIAKNSNSKINEIECIYLLSKLIDDSLFLTSVINQLIYSSNLRTQKDIISNGLLIIIKSNYEPFALYFPDLIIGEAVILNS